MFLFFKPVEKKLRYSILTTDLIFCRKKRELCQVAERLGCQSQDGCMKRQQEQKESTLIIMLFINYEKNSLGNKVI